MARSKLFEYAILYHPQESRDAGGNDVTPPTVLVQAPKQVLAKSEKEVGMRGAREIPSDYDDKLEQVEIVVRPF